MYAWHFLKDDGRSASGSRKAAKDGTIERHRGNLVPCKSGLHASPTISDALGYAQGSLLSYTEIPDKGDNCVPHGSPTDKYCVRWRRKIKTVNVERELRQVAIDCATRALEREREAGREPDPRSWAAVAAASDFLAGRIDRGQLNTARDAARYAAYAAWDAAWDAAAGAAEDAAWDAAWDATQEWQRDYLEALILPLFGEVINASNVYPLLEGKTQGGAE